MKFEFSSQTAADSRIVAKIFGVDHSNLIWKIKHLFLQFPEIEDEYFFRQCEVVQNPNRTGSMLEPYYIMTSEGFYCLCVIECIDAFDKIDESVWDINIRPRWIKRSIPTENVDNKSLFALARYLRSLE